MALIKKNSTVNSNEVFVFAGATISAAEIRALMPDCQICPPARVGDIHRALHAGAKIILLIDGDLYAGVTRQKEILLALQSGVVVVGCSAFGAVRAVELRDYGMRGVGRVYEWLLQHLPMNKNHEVLYHYEDRNGRFLRRSESLINWRFRLSQLRLDHAENLNVSRATKQLEQVLEQLEGVYYQERQLQLPDDIRQHVDMNFDIQKADARQALEAIQSEMELMSAPAFESRLPETLFFNKELIASYKLGKDKFIALLADTLRVRAELEEGAQLDFLFVANEVQKFKVMTNRDQLEFAIAQAVHPLGSHLMRMEPHLLGPIEQKQRHALQLIAANWLDLDEKYRVSFMFTEEMMLSQKQELFQSLQIFDSLSYLRWKAKNSSSYSMEELMNVVLPFLYLTGSSFRLESLLGGQPMKYHKMNWVKIAEQEIFKSVQSSRVMASPAQKGENHEYTT
jgi:hypothetical protein